jgi:hypothetical protein
MALAIASNARHAGRTTFRSPNAPNPTERAELPPRTMRLGEKKA